MSKRLQITISDELHDALEKKARALHINEKDAAQMAIVDWVARPIVPARVVVSPAHPTEQDTPLTMLRQSGVGQ